MITPPLNDRLAHRGDFMKIMCVPDGRGGYDIALRIDGTYSFKDDAREMARYWSEQLGIPLATS